MNGRDGRGFRRWGLGFSLSDGHLLISPLSSLSSLLSSLYPSSLSPFPFFSLRETKGIQEDGGGGERKRPVRERQRAQRGKTCKGGKKKKKREEKRRKREEERKEKTKKRE